jgi:hypothetical protein
VRPVLPLFLFAVRGCAHVGASGPGDESPAYPPGQAVQTGLPDAELHRLFLDAVEVRPLMPAWSNELLEGIRRETAPGAPLHLAAYWWLHLDERTLSAAGAVRLREITRMSHERSAITFRGVVGAMILGGYGVFGGLVLAGVGCGPGTGSYRVPACAGSILVPLGAGAVLGWGIYGWRERVNAKKRLDRLIEIKERALRESEVGPQGIPDGS